MFTPEMRKPLRMGEGVLSVGIALSVAPIVHVTHVGSHPGLIAAGQVSVPMACVRQLP